MGSAQPAVPDATLNITRTLTLILATNSPSAAMVQVSHSLRCITSGNSCSFVSFEDVYEAVLGRDSTAEDNGWAGELPDFVWRYETPFLFFFCQFPRWLDGF
jgi:hypothetical protein